MKLFARWSATLPPTQYGYQPPEGAHATGWICASLNCGRESSGSDPRSWPTRCPECGGPIATGSLVEPWQHEARRVELDARLNRRLFRGDPANAEAENLVWYFVDSLYQQRPDLAETYRVRLDRFITTEEARRRYFNGGTHRWWMVHHANAHGAVNLAARELEEWYACADLTDIETNSIRGDNCRQLAQQMIEFIEYADGIPSATVGRIWTLLEILMRHMYRVATADVTRGFTRLHQIMSGRQPEEVALEAALVDLRLAHEGGGIDSVDRLPAQTVLRMEALGRYEYDPANSGLDNSLVWSVCLKPYMLFSTYRPAALVGELAAAVEVAGGWSIVGAARCLQQLVADQAEEPSFLAVLDGAVDFLHRSGAVPAQLRRPEWKRWTDVHGPASW
jgi:hypothetical protein